MTVSSDVYGCLNLYCAMHLEVVEIEILMKS